jgi:hypothetical protein
MAKEKEVMASGMTMHDYFAGEILSGVMSRTHIAVDDLDKWAAYAYQAADAMMKLRTLRAESGNGTADSEDD